MNPAHLHLILNHIPVVGLGAALLLLLYAMARKNDELKRVTLAAFVLLALVAIAVYLTGKAAEDSVEHLPGVSEAIIDRHQDAATVSLVAIELLGAVSLAGLIFSRRSNSLLRWFAVISLVISLVAAGLITWTANLGGQIRHTEIRAGAPASTQDNGDAEGDRERTENNRGKKRDDH
jgi:uncharacterized membrane protein